MQEGLSLALTLTPFNIGPLPLVVNIDTYAAIFLKSLTISSNEYYHYDLMN